jgi:hypothetical protein
LVVVETTGLDALGAATGRILTVMQIDKPAKAATVASTITFAKDGNDPMLFHILNESDSAELVLFSRSKGEISLCGPLTATTPGTCTRVFSSTYAITAIVPGMDHRGPSFSVLFERKRRDAMPKLSWLNTFLNIKKDKMVYFELITFSAGNDGRLSRF